MAAHRNGRCVQHNNGIVSGPPPTVPHIGSYARQLIRKIPHGTKLPWYILAPSDNFPRQASQGLDRGTVFGPVHAVEDTLSTKGFISVMVPAPFKLLPQSEHPNVPELIWINVFALWHGGREVSDHFCELVLDDEQKSWYKRGWRDLWIGRLVGQQ